MPEVVSPFPSEDNDPLGIKSEGGVPASSGGGVPPEKSGGAGQSGGDGEPPELLSTGSDDAHNTYIQSQRNWYLQFTMNTPFNEGMDEAKVFLADLLEQIKGIYIGEARELPENLRPTFTLGNSGYPLISVEENTAIWHTKVHITNINRENETSVDQMFGIIKNAGVLPVTLIEASASLGIMGRASQGSNWGGGGPGGLPWIPTVPIIGTGISDTTAPYYFKLPASLDAQRPNPAGGNPLSALRDNKGKDTIVAILDTCPTKAVWEAAVIRYTTGPNPNPLIVSLNQLYLSGKFRLFPSGDGTLDPADEATIDRELAGQDYRSYPMQDHGIFVAGIIHSIAPEATIWLYRDINDNGVCVFDSPQDGLAEAVRQQPSVPHLAGMPMKPLIVNSSLTLMMPLEEEIANRQNPKKSDPEHFWFLSMSSATVVAAAGNEATYKTRPAPIGTSGPVPPYPRFPAGFESTLGISSLDKAFARSNFANWADDFDLPNEYVRRNGAGVAGAGPVSRRGLATKGGSTLQFGNVRISDPDDSILGLYISKEFPLLAQTVGSSTMYTAISNTQGWAYWSGTSFSTAIITGVLALLATDAYNNNKPTDREALIAALLGHCPDLLDDDFTMLSAFGAAPAVVAAAAAIAPTNHVTENMLKVTQG